MSAAISDIAIRRFHNEVIPTAEIPVVDIASFRAGVIEEVT